MEKQNKWSFKEAFHRLPYNEMPIVRKEIEQALGISAHPTWYKRMNGEVEPKISEYLAIQRIFKKRGIKAFQN